MSEEERNNSISSPTLALPSTVYPGLMALMKMGGRTGLSAKIAGDRKTKTRKDEIKLKEI